MFPVQFNRKELCKLPINELEQLKQIILFWGLFWNDQTNKLMGRLSNETIRIVGVSRKEISRIRQLVEHTNVSLTSEQYDTGYNIYVFLVENQQSFLQIESKEKMYTYEPYNGPFKTVEEWMYKGFTPPVYTRDMKIYVKKHAFQELSEWIAYLILQLTLKETPELLKDVPKPTYEKFLRSILTPINPFLSSHQLKAVWPAKPPNNDLEDEKNAEPFNPFKYSNNSSKPSQINPFKKSKKTNTRVINPFFKK